MRYCQPKLLFSVVANAVRVVTYTYCYHIPLINVIQNINLQCLENYRQLFQRQLAKTACKTARHACTFFDVGLCACRLQLIKTYHVFQGYFIPSIFYFLSMYAY